MSTSSMSGGEQGEEEEEEDDGQPVRLTRSRSATR